jgi:tRNA A37 threonylcarbamoyladenosine synthetase subunit TsaC/SUA5/YrdC
LTLPGEGTDGDPYEMRQILGRQVDLIIDGGGGLEASTVVSFSE